MPARELTIDDIADPNAKRIWQGVADEIREYEDAIFLTTITLSAVCKVILYNRLENVEHIVDTPIAHVLANTLVHDHGNIKLMSVANLSELVKQLFEYDEEYEVTITKQ